MLKKSLVLIVTCLLWLLAAAESQAAVVGHTLKIDGLVRTYTVFIPASYYGKSAVPVVIMLHGAGATGTGVIRETGWARKAEEAGFLAVFPDAARPNPASAASFLANPQLWNDGSGRGLAFLQPVDDVKFLNLLIGDLARNYAIDRQAVFLTGFSSGASLTFKAAEELPGTFAAIAPVAGPPGTTVQTCGDGRHELRFILVDGLGHLWPGGEPVFPEAYIGKDPGHINATDAIWAFFAASRAIKR